MTRKPSHTTFAALLKRRRWSARDAEEVLSAWRESGEPLSKFAARHGLVAERLLRWRRVTRGSAIQFRPVKVVRATRDEDPWVGSGVELVLRGGRRVAVGRDFDAALLEALVRAVESWPC